MEGAKLDEQVADLSGEEIEQDGGKKSWRGDEGNMSRCMER